MVTKFRVGGVPEHFNLPWQLALDDGAFARQGLEVEFIEVPEGTGELTRALRDDELDVALVLTEGAVADIVRHDASRMVKVWVSSPLVWGIHVARDSPIRRLRDIRGRRIAISRYGSGSHLIAVVDAAERGWDTANMSFVVVNNLQGARRALAGSEAEVFLWERHMTQPLVDSGEFRRVGLREVPWPAFVATARLPMLGQHDKQLRAMLDIAANAARNFRRRESSAELIACRYGLRQQDALAWLATVKWGNSYRRPTAALNRAANALESQGVIGSGSFDPNRAWHSIV